MRPEHKPTADENDMRANTWNAQLGRSEKLYVYIGRPGVTKAIKARSHRSDRRKAQRELRKEL